MNPWIGVLVIALAIGGTLGFSALHEPVPSYLVALAGVGIAILQANVHAKTDAELRALKSKTSETLPPPKN